MQHFGRMITGIGRQLENLIILVVHHHAELRHQFQSDVDIGLGNQFADHVDFKRFAGERQRHQQGGQELARYVAFNRNHARAAVVAGVNLQRRVAVVAKILHIGTGQAQCINQIANRTLVHTRHAVQMVVAAEYGQRGGERSEGGAGIAEKQIGLALREYAVAAVYFQTAFIQIFPLHAQRGQRFEHAVGVV